MTQCSATYVAFYQNLTRDRLGRLREICAPNVRFRDPFNDVTGVEAYIAVLEKMFDDVLDPRFEIVDRAVSDQVCYLRWDFTFRSKPGSPAWQIEGMSEVHFDSQGLVVAHLDHWDSGSQFYGRLPLLGWLIRLVRQRVSLT